MTLFGPWIFLYQSFLHAENAHKGFDGWASTSLLPFKVEYPHSSSHPIILRTMLRALQSP